MDRIIEINHIIIHKIDKKQNDISELQKTEYECEKTDPLTIKLSNELYNVFNHNINFGNFDNKEESNASFKVLLDEYNNEIKTFIEFTQQAMDLLKVHMDSENFSKGGYLVFTDILCNQVHYLVVYFVRDKEGVSLEIKEEKVYITNEVHIDTDKLAMACRVNLDQYCSDTIEDNPRYL